MSSFQRRLESFKHWGEQDGVCTPEYLSVAGFSCETVGADQRGTVCYLCNKHLEGWETTDVPIEEHFSHSHKCPFFNLNVIEGRIKTFNDERWDKTKDETRKIAKAGFFLYNIKEPIKNEIFCFNCGFNQSGNIDSDRCLGHQNMCKVSRKYSKFNLSNKGGFFYIDLIMGRYVDEMVRYCYSDVYIPITYIKEMGQFFESVDRRLGFRPVEEALMGGLNSLIKKIEEEFDGDIRRIMAVIDEKANEKMKRHE
jgi:hypothetical protein